MNIYISRRMTEWSDWLLKREEGALGFPKQCSYTRLAASGGSAGFTPGTDSDAMEVDAIMAQIKLANPKIYRVLHMFFGVDFKDGRPVPTAINTAQLLAVEYGCHRDTLYTWLDQGERMLLDGFHENDVLAHIRK